MSFDKEAKNRGFLVGIPNELYTISLNKTSSLYLEKISGFWVVWRENYALDCGKCISHKTIAKSRDFIYSLRKATEYIEYIRKFKEMKGRWN